MPGFVINPPVFFGSVAITTVFLVTGVLFPSQAESIFAAMQGWILASFGWFYLLSVAIFLASVVFFAASRFGNLKLGPDDSTPDFRYVSWVAMLFAAGMGIGLMYFADSEMMPPPVSGRWAGSAGAFRFASLACPEEEPDAGGESDHAACPRDFAIPI